MKEALFSSHLQKQPLLCFWGVFVVRWVYDYEGDLGYDDDLIEMRFGI
jgi:hypothetical protein